MKKGLARQINPSRTRNSDPYFYCTFLVDPFPSAGRWA